jgi:hypothetical protein
MKAPEKYAVLRTYPNHFTINRFINKKYGTTFEYDSQYLHVDTKYTGSPNGAVHKYTYVQSGFILVSYEQFLEIFAEEERETEQKAKRAIEDRIKNEIKGLYRERLKTLEDTIVELRYENQQLKQQLARTSPVSC